MQRDNQLVSAGTFLFGFGLLAILPDLTGRELLLLSWMGAWQAPIGVSAMIVGAVLFAIGKLQDLRNASPVPRDPAPAAPAHRPDPAGPTRASSMPVVQPNVLSGQAPVSPDPKGQR